MNNEIRNNSYKRLLIGLIVVAGVALAVGGYWFYRQEARTIRAEKYSELKALAELKAGQIVAWRNERLADARMNSSGIVRMYVLRWLKTPDDPASRAAIQSRLQVFRETEGYQNMILATPDGRLLLSLDTHLAELETDTKQLVAQVVASGKAMFGDLFRCPPCNNQIHLDVAAPILDDEQRPVAVLVLRSDPGTILYPLIQSWPLPSKSAETLLIRKDGNDALFLNVLRHRPDPVLTFRIPLSRTNVAAVQAVLGKTGIFGGKDYRGVDALADLRPVPGSLWFMVAKVDTNEILADVRYRGEVILLLVVLGILMTGLLAAFVGSYQRKRTNEIMKRTAKEWTTTFNSIGDLVSIQDRDFKLIKVNKAYADTFKMKPEDLVGRHCFEIVHNLKSPPEGCPHLQAMETKQHVSVEVFEPHLGCYLDVSCSPVFGEQENIIGTVHTIKNITARKRAEEALRASDEQMRFVTDHAPVLIAHCDHERRYKFVNQPYVEMFGLRVADIVGKHPRDVLGEEAYANASPYMEAALAGQATEYDLVLSAISGGSRTVHVSYVPERDASGRVVGFVAAITDITARNKTDENLLIRDKAIATSIDAIAFADPKGILIYANQAFLKIWGYASAEDVLGKSSIDFWQFEEKAEMVIKALEDQGGWEGELTGKHKDGTLFDVQLSSSLVKDANGKTICMMGSFKDVTARKRLEEALQESERNLALTIKSIGDAVITIDTQGHVLRMNPVAERLTGWSLEEAAGRPLAEVFHIINQHTRKRVDNPVAKVLQTGKIQGLANDTVLIARSGEEYIIADSAAAITDDQTGQTVGVVLVFRDVTEHARIDAALRKKTHALNERVKELGLLIHISELARKPNLAIEEFLRRTVELIPVAWQYPENTSARITLGDQEFKTRNFKESAWKLASDIMVHGKRAGAVEVYYAEERSQGNTGSFLKEEQTLLNLITERLGRIIERREAEEALQQKVEELVRSNQDMEQFVHAAAHDIQEPLRVVSSFLQLLEKRYRDVLDKTGQDYIHRSVNAAQRGQILIRDLLDYSRITTRAAGILKPVSAETILQTALENLQIAVEKNRALITHDRLPMINGDDSQLVRVFQNLIGNAVKFYDQDHPQVHISAEDKGGEWQFAFRDNGIGISVEDINRVFTVFIRLHSREQYPGSGIGLAICKKIVEQHGGRVWVESEPGTGSTFFVSLPKHEQPLEIGPE